ncbi:NaeI family type II restriction endonuclease [Mycetocola zhadangensis]|uniref:Restriction endonuclease n=1 Tax=Mycetocola zhadangensis TaxID=1164595 RepID=A0A3L7J251_9MICO|nr:NaeI family type II restriction endonuclease [Mycetocola zhadangensis]RLQ84643.1 restriction endonuclease [Mycetocola zhadangensis]GGE96081.1 hypothetical protein GCM10011313_18790 [Mycetocola zhadangensis]
MTLFDYPGAPENDHALTAVVAEMKRLDPDGTRAAKVFRRTFDQLYDGQRTGRFKVDQLFKTEKTHFGTLIEINLQREFEFVDGDVLDFRIAGHEVDCKYSHTGAWMLPPESFEQLILVAQADDLQSQWSLGVVRATLANRRLSENRDKKTGLNSVGRSNVTWLHRNAPMQPNVLAQLSPADVKRIFASSSGQQRINELFRVAINRRLSRSIIATVAQQDDFMKRVRANGGAREKLQPEGYLVLGGDYAAQVAVARALNITIPEPGELVSVRVVPATRDDRNSVMLDGAWWRAALPSELIEVPAPTLTMLSNKA